MIPIEDEEEFESVNRNGLNYLISAEDLDYDHYVPSLSEKPHIVANKIKCWCEPSFDEGTMVHRENFEWSAILSTKH